MKPDINALVGEKVLGWCVDCDTRQCWDPAQPSGAMWRCPAFTLGQNIDIVVAAMERGGFKLRRQAIAPDVNANVGQLFVATFTSDGCEPAEQEADSEPLAICVAALKAVGARSYVDD